MNDLKNIHLSILEEDTEIIKELLSEVSDYANNTPVTYTDVVSGLLNFYKNAKLVDYHRQYQRDIAMYIGNRVTEKR